MSNEEFIPPKLVEFAYIVDGEVVEVQGYSEDAEMQIAIYSSDPKIVRVTDENRRMVTGHTLHGATWDGEKFLPTQLME